MAPQEGANRRSVWDHIRPERNPTGHRAAFPSDLPRDCIQIGTSEAGVCPHCGAQWARVVERSPSTFNVRVRDAKKGTLAEKSGFDTSATGAEMDGYGPEVAGSPGPWAGVPLAVARLATQPQPRSWTRSLGPPRPALRPNG